MTSWTRVVCALLVAAGSSPAQSVSEAARDLSRKVAASLRPREGVRLSVRNISSLDASSADQVRRTLETELRADSAPAAELQVTISENPDYCLLVAEVRRGEERQVFISTLPRAAAGPQPAARVRLEKHWLLDQVPRVLDIAVRPDGVLVLDASRVALYRREGAVLEPGASAALPLSGWLPRDLRGRLVVEEGSFRAYLPGVVCSGPLPPSSVECTESRAGWPILRGLTVSLAPGRNLLEARNLPLFFSAAAVGQQWLIAEPEGRMRVYNPSPAPLPGSEQWGSDIAGLEPKCGGPIPVLASRAGMSTDRDTIQAFEVTGGRVVPLSDPVEFPGPVTALWPAGPDSAAVVCRDLRTHRYAAFLLAIGCGS